MAAELAAAEARLASSQDVAHLRTAGECWRLIVVVRSAATTSAFLCQCCRPMQSQICERGRRSEMWNTELCISAAMRHALGVARGVADVLQGGCAADPVQFGMTTDEERSACRPAAQVENLIYGIKGIPSFAIDNSCSGRFGQGLALRLTAPRQQHAAKLRLYVRAPHCMGSTGVPHHTIYQSLQWPLLPGGDEPQPPNAELRLYGGAAFERAVAEFQEAARLLAMPPGAVLGFEHLGFKGHLSKQMSRSLTAARLLAMPPGAGGML